MKKINSILFMFIFLNQCSGYKPIFASSDVQFKISDYHITGNKMLGNKVFSRLNSISRFNKNNDSIESVEIFLDVKKSKNSTSKDSSGKTIEYKISLSAEVEVKDFLNEENILKQNFTSSLSYKIQEQYSDTLKQEQITTDNLINNLSQDILINLSKNISSQ